MGTSKAPERCFITGRNTENFPSEWDSIEYFVNIKNQRIKFVFPRGYQNDEFVKKNKYVLMGLILNDKFPIDYCDSKNLDNEGLRKIINDSVIPRTPEDRLNNLLNYLYSLQDFEGSLINFPNGEEKDDLANRLYFRNYEEMVFYLFTLKSQGLIIGIDATTKDGSELISISLTYSGLARIAELNESGSQSLRCFVAMSFSVELSETRDAIKTVVSEAGFEPILIDEIHYDSEVTVNDAMIAEIKKCKFLIADFTQHRHGVYFEAGFALGLKRPVIYLCHRNDFSNTHFDTNHYPHIIYSNLNELMKKLKLKIDAWIN